MTPRVRGLLEAWKLGPLAHESPESEAVRVQRIAANIQELLKAAHPHALSQESIVALVLLIDGLVIDLVQVELITAGFVEARVKTKGGTRDIEYRLLVAPQGSTP